MYSHAPVRTYSKVLACRGSRPQPERCGVKAVFGGVLIKFDNWYATFGGYPRDSTVIGMYSCLGSWHLNCDS